MNTERITLRSSRTASTSSFTDRRSPLDGEFGGVCSGTGEDADRIGEQPGQSREVSAWF